MTSIADCPASPGPAPRPVKPLDSVPKSKLPDKSPPGTCAWRFDAPLRYWYLISLCCLVAPTRTRKSARMHRIGDPSILASTPPNSGIRAPSRVLTTVAGNAAVRSWSSTGLQHGTRKPSNKGLRREGKRHEAKLEWREGRRGGGKRTGRVFAGMNQGMNG